MEDQHIQRLHFCLGRESMTNRFRSELALRARMDLAVFACMFGES